MATCYDEGEKKDLSPCFHITTGKPQIRPNKFKTVTGHSEGSVMLKRRCLDSVMDGGRLLDQEGQMSCLFESSLYLLQNKRHRQKPE